MILIPLCQRPAPHSGECQVNNWSLHDQGNHYLKFAAMQLSLFEIEPDSSRKPIINMNDAPIKTASSFECLLYINPTRTDTIAGKLFWKIYNSVSKEDMELPSDASNKDFIVTTLENSITLNILGDFSGRFSCIHGDDSVKINVVTKGKVHVDTSLLLLKLVVIIAT